MNYWYNNKKHCKTIDYTVYVFHPDLSVKLRRVNLAGLYFDAELGLPCLMMLFKALGHEVFVP